jgi:hypothetical protein
MSCLRTVYEGEKRVLRLREHNVADYATLRDMDTTDVAVLDEADQACLDQLGQYLVSTDAWQRFGIWLLHKHFEPTAREVFVESITTTPRATHTKLVQRSTYPAQGLHATGMRFDPDVNCGVGVIGMEFAEAADFGSTSPLCPDDEAVLAGIAQRLGSHNKIERFGVRLIRNPLNLTENEVLLETCDRAHRSLHCSVTEHDNPDATNSIETTWQWKPSSSQTEPTAIQMCFTRCPWVMVNVNTLRHTGREGCGVSGGGPPSG